MKMMKETIRPLEKRDLAAVASLDGPLFDMLRQHGDYALENTAACWQGETLLGLGCLSYHGSWRAPREKGLLRKLTLSLRTPRGMAEAEEERVRGLLVEALQRRLADLWAEEPDTRVAINAYVDGEDGALLQLLVDCRFSLEAVLPVMGRDLEEDLPDIAPPGGVRIAELPLDEAGLARYVAANAQASGEGACINPEEIRFLSRSKDFRCYVALAGEQVIGSVSTWGAEDGRGETEKVFMVPEWRRRGVARAMISHALRGLRQDGYTLATLMVRGANRGALWLYTSLGYTLRFLLVEALYLPENGRKS